MTAAPSDVVAVPGPTLAAAPALSTLPPAVSAELDADARYVFEERLGVAMDLGMDTGPGSEAEQVALREARRAAAGVPASVVQAREPDFLDGVLSAFGPVTTLRVVGVAPREKYAPPPPPPQKGGTP